MFSDTHFHFQHFTEAQERESGVDAAEFGRDILVQMAHDDVLFGLDIGTKCDDLAERVQCLRNSIDLIDDHNTKAKVERMIHYSAGIWPDVDEISDRWNAMESLEQAIEDFKEEGMGKKLVAIGEGGIDHHWNPSGVDGRSEDDFDEAMYEGERELFQMQLELAKKMNLPFIVHSRDAFEDTMDCIKNIGWDKGVIHCFTYDIDVARAFLDRGWYLAFGGSTTYTKKSKMDAMNELLSFVPDDRLLLETDSPYLAPVPLRGTINNPSNIKLSYEFIGSRRGKTPGQLSKLVDKNIRELFKI